MHAYVHTNVWQLPPGTYLEPFPLAFSNSLGLPRTRNPVPGRGGAIYAYQIYVIYKCGVWKRFQTWIQDPRFQEKLLGSKNKALPNQRPGPLVDPRSCFLDLGIQTSDPRSFSWNLGTWIQSFWKRLGNV